MDLTKQENVSRQSSILKPPKQRQPLQCVATNPSSSESSPTIKIKRRVSFAKNKRIKEFCNEAEPQAVWDDTYEEHDLSNTKSSSASNENPSTISVPLEDKENFPVQLFLPADQVQCTEVQESVPCEEGDNLSQCEMEMDNSLMNYKPETDGAETDKLGYPNTTIYFDDGMDMTTYVPSTMLDYNQRRPNENRLDINSASNSTELTQAISRILAVGSSNNMRQNTGPENITCNTDVFGNRTNCNSDMPIEFTSVIPSSTWIKPINPEEVTENFTCKTMEFTAAVHSSDIYKKVSKSDEPEKTKTFHDKSMEITKAVENQKIHHLKKIVLDECGEKTKVFANKTMEFTETVLSTNPCQSYLSVEKVTQSEKIHVIEDRSMKMPEAVINHIGNQEQTKFFDNKIMDFTEAIVSNKDIIDSVPHKENAAHSEKTSIFYDQSMEMTGAVFSCKENKENTEVFTNKSMDLTEFVPSNKNINQSILQRGNATHSKKTNIFHDQSMEMTAAVPSCREAQERTKFFANKSMDLTEAIIPNKDRNQSMEMTRAIQNQKCYQLNCFPQRDESEGRDGTIKSMNLKDAIPNQNFLQVIASPEKVIQSEKTNIFHNGSMEITEAVANWKDIPKPPSATGICNQNDADDFCEQTMEITKAVQNHRVFHTNPKNVNLMDARRLNSENIVFEDKSMEMTRGIPNNKIHNINSHVLYEDETNIFHNKPMDMTEVVPNNNFHPTQCTEVLPDERTKYFHDKSIEMTGSIPNQRIQFGNLAQNNSNVENQEKTRIFPNKSMELTKAISKIVNVPQINQLAEKDLRCEKTAIFHDKPMDMTEVVPNSNFHPTPCTEVLPNERTKFFHNKSIEMTEAITNQKIQFANFTQNNSNIENQEKTKIFPNKSMELTKVITTTVNVPEVNELAEKDVNCEKTAISHDKSMEITEAIWNNKQIHRFDSNLPPSIEAQSHVERNNVFEDGTNVFQNKSMEMTEAVIPQPGAGMNITLEDLRNKNAGNRTNILSKSMEITGAIPIARVAPNVSMEMLQMLEKINRSNSTENIINIIREPNGVQYEGLPSILQVSSFPNEQRRNMDLRNSTPPHVSVTYSTENRKLEAMPATLYPVTAKEKSTLSFSESMDISDTIAVTQNNESKEKFDASYSVSMEMTETMSMHQGNVDKLSKPNSYGNQTESEMRKVENIIEPIPKQLNILRNENHREKITEMERNEKTKFFSNKSMEVTETVPDYQHNISGLERMISADTTENLPTIHPPHFHQQFQDKTREEKTNVYLDASMEMTDAVPLRDLKILNHSKDQNIFNRMDLLNSMNKNSRKENESNYHERYSKREETFNRITSDELNSLCASMNLPTQKYANDGSSSFQTNYISPVCNDIEVLRDSLENNTIFKQLESSYQNNVESNRQLFNFSSRVRDNSSQKDNYRIQNEIGSADRNMLRSGKNNTLSEMMNTISSNINSQKSETSHTNFCYQGRDPKNDAKKVDKPLKEIRSLALSGLLETPYDIEVLNGNSDCRINPSGGKYTEINNQHSNELCNTSNHLSVTPRINTEPEQDERYFHVIRDADQHRKKSIYSSHDISVGIDPAITLPLKRRSNDMNDPINRKMMTIDGTVHTSTEICNKADENVSNEKPEENSLTRMVSDDTEMLISIDLQTKFSHPLIIKEKTTIDSTKECTPSKTHLITENSGTESKGTSNKNQSPSTSSETIKSNLNCLARGQIQDEENIKDVSLPTVTNLIENYVLERSSISNHETIESSLRVDPLRENYLDLEEIQPPSFLSSSSQDDLDDNVDVPEPSSSFKANEHENTSHKIKEQLDHYTKNRLAYINTENLKIFSSSGSNSSSENVKRDKKHKSSSKKDIKQKSPLNKDTAMPAGYVENNIEVAVLEKEPLPPFELMIENVRDFEKSDDCIWTVRSMSPKLMAINFITKSLVVLLRLNEFEKACNRDIEGIEFVSCLRADTKNVLLKIVHNLLLSKLNSKLLLEKYRMYEDILPLLEYISSEIVLTMNFMFDIERLNATNLSCVDTERIIFRVASKKASVILEISMIIKVFNEIGPDDIDVKCITGDIRKADIKQLIVNIKRDYKFLSRYINDVKAYITLMEESTSSRRN